MNLRVKVGRAMYRWPSILTTALALVFISYVVLSEIRGSATAVTYADGRERAAFKRGKSARRLPQAICIGSKKSGTGTLMAFLALNHHISARKHEAHFFDREENYEKGYKYYIEMMEKSKPHQITMEKTPKYLVHRRTPQRIQAMNSSVKLIVILRDPIKRLISDYDHEMRLPDRPFVRIEKSMSLQSLALTKDGRLNMTYEPVVASMYDVHVYRWLQFFPRHQLLVLDGEKFIKDPLPTLHQCEEFLGIPHTIRRDMFIVDEEKGYYCLKKTGCVRGKGHTHVEYPEEFLNQLRTAYAPHNERLAAMLGQTFEWMK